jgi:IgGFc binding protein
LRVAKAAAARRHVADQRTMSQIKGPCCNSVSINGGDPTGTLISSSQPIFVTSGAANSIINATLSADHLSEALPDVNELGTKYVIIPSTYGDYVKIVGKFLYAVICNITKV